MSGSRDTITLRFMAAPTDAGYAGTVGAGRVLEWIDKTGFACAAGWSGHYCVTAYAGNVTFTRPVEVGHLVEVTARLVHTGRSSMHILVTVESGDIRTGSLTLTTECLIIFVAVDDTGRSTPVPTWQPADEAARRDQAAAVQRIALRAQIEEAMEGQHYTDHGTAPRMPLRFLAAPTDVNWGGKVHGGIVMRWIDEAAHVLATAYTGSSDNVAVYAGGVRFYRPLRIGDLVEVEARLLHTGPRSMHISVHVRSGPPYRLDESGELDLTTHCLIVFVALDDERQAAPVPAWVPRSGEDEALDGHAWDLIRIRRELDDRNSLRLM